MVQSEYVIQDCSQFRPQQANFPFWDINLLNLVLPLLKVPKHLLFCLDKHLPSISIDGTYYLCLMPTHVVIVTNR